MKFLAFLAVTAALMSAAEFPSGDSLMRLCIEREGTAKALARADSAVITGTVELVGHNLAGTISIYQQGEKYYTIVQLPGIGALEEGFDGQVAWENNILQGPRIKDGDELEIAKRNSRMALLTAWRDYYTKAETVGSEDVEGKPAWKVAMTPKKGAVEYDYFDKTSGLLVKTEQTIPTSLGEIATEMTLGDYRPVDGVQTAFRMTQMAMTQTMAMHFEKVTYGAQIPASRFELPEAVKALQKPQ